MRIPFAFLALAALILPAFPANADPMTCRIGKPSYCLKYGGSRCEKANDRGPTACAEWQRACLRCHEPIGECLGYTRIDAGSPRCKTCTDNWHACMRAIDAAHWPNRLRP